MSHDNRDLCNNPFVALFGSIGQVELYKASIKDRAEAGMYAGLAFHTDFYNVWLVLFVYQYICKECCVMGVYGMF